MADHSKIGQIVRFWIQNGRQSHLKAGHKKCPRDGHSKAGPSGFRWGTVQDWSGFRMLTVIDQIDLTKNILSSVRIFDLKTDYVLGIQLKDNVNSQPKSVI